MDRHSRHRRRKSYSYSRSPSPRYSRRFSPDQGMRRSGGGASYQRFRRDPQQPASPNQVLGVFGLSFDTTEAELKDLFSAFGPTDKINLIYDHETRKSRGFAFVYFENLEDAKNAMSATNGKVGYFDSFFFVEVTILSNRS